MQMRSYISRLAWRLTQSTLEPITGLQDYQLVLIELTNDLDRPNQLEV